MFISVSFWRVCLNANPAARGADFLRYGLQGFGVSLAYLLCEETAFWTFNALVSGCVIDAELTPNANATACVIGAY